MAYDEALAGRVRTVLQDQPEIKEKKMFGGLAFMLRGNMCCGIVKDELMVRVGPARYEAALARPEARPMDFGGKGRPMKGMVFVAPHGMTGEETLAEWVGMGVAYAGSLPAKP
jgi:TfoX/Sxy family transcriptional regulator of competence genes